MEEKRANHRRNGLPEGWLRKVWPGGGAVLRQKSRRFGRRCGGVSVRRKVKSRRRMGCTDRGTYCFAAVHGPMAGSCKDAGPCPASASADFGGKVGRRWRGEQLGQLPTSSGTYTVRIPCAARAQPTACSAFPRRSRSDLSKCLPAFVPGAGQAHRTGVECASWTASPSRTPSVYNANSYQTRSCVPISVVPLQRLE